MKLPENAKIVAETHEFDEPVGAVMLYGYTAIDVKPCNNTIIQTRYMVVGNHVFVEIRYKCTYNVGGNNRNAYSGTETMSLTIGLGKLNKKDKTVINCSDKNQKFTDSMFPVKNGKYVQFVDAPIAYAENGKFDNSYLILENSNIKIPLLTDKKNYHKCGIVFSSFKKDIEHFTVIMLDITPESGKAQYFGGISTPDEEESEDTLTSESSTVELLKTSSKGSHATCCSCGIVHIGSGGKKFESKK